MKKGKKVIWTENTYNFMWEQIMNRFGAYSVKPESKWSNFKEDPDFIEFATKFAELIEAKSAFSVLLQIEICLTTSDVRPFLGGKGFAYNLVAAINKGVFSIDTAGNMVCLD